jgi:hypothetical protein
MHPFCPQRLGDRVEIIPRHLDRAGSAPAFGSAGGVSNEDELTAAPGQSPGVGKNGCGQIGPVERDENASHDPALSFLLFSL